MGNATYTACTGTFYDSGGPTANYQDAENYSITFRSGAANKAVVVTFTSFTYTAGESLSVYDGPTLLSTFTAGNSVILPNKFFGISGELTFVWRSTNGVNEAGWVAEVSCSSEFRINEGGQKNGCSYLFYDSGGPNASYGNFENSQMTLFSPPGNAITVDFKYLDLAAGAQLSIYNGTAAVGAPIGNFSSFSGKPNQVKSNCGCLTFKFSSVTGPIIGNGRGWEAYVKCTGLFTNPQCYNEGFELATTNGWTGAIGVNDGRLSCSCDSKIIPGRQTLMTKALGNDTYGGFPVVAPLGSNYSVKLGNAITGAESEQLFYKVGVSKANSIFTYYYAVVLEDGGHDSIEQPFFKIEMFDSKCQNIACGEYLVAANQGISGFSKSTVRNNTIYKKWTPVSVDLRKFIGDTVTIKFTTGDCTQGGHFGYAYIDAKCVPAIVNGANPCLPLNGQPLPICGPDGFKQYKWSPGNDTTMCKNVTAAGTYTLELTPFSVCIETTTFTYVVYDCLTLNYKFKNFAYQRLRNNTLALNWSTASELGLGSFEVEKSRDAMNYYSISNPIPSIGNSVGINSYQYIDSQYTGELSFYRLKMKDKYGQESYSEVLVVESKAENNWVISPQPVQDDLNIRCSLYNGGDLHLAIYNALGKVVWEKDMSLESGPADFKIDLSQLDSGIYFLKAIGSSQAEALNYQLVKK